MQLLRYFLCLACVVWVSAEPWEIKDTRTYSSKKYISSVVDTNIVGEISTSPSVLKCSLHCSQDETYQSFYYSSPTQECYCNIDLDLSVNTTTVNTGLQYGQVDSYYQRSTYLTFQRFHRLPYLKDCLDLNLDGYTTDGVYVIHPLAGVAVDVWCDMTNGGWTVIQRRQDGSEDFYRLWADYVNGFGNRTGEYWLGLNYMNILIQSTTVLRIEMETFGDMGLLTAFAEYADFRVDTALTNYQLLATGFSGDCGDSLEVIHNGMMFTTQDMDNDLSAQNCAVVSKGAWWYNACHDSNLNGMYLGGPMNTTGDGVIWGSCWGQNYSLMKTVMKIRRA